MPPGDPQHALAGARDDERRAEAAEAGLLCRQQRLGAEVPVSRAALLVPALGEDLPDLLDGLLQALGPPRATGGYLLPWSCVLGSLARCEHRTSRNRVDAAPPMSRA